MRYVFKTWRKLFTQSITSLSKIKTGYFSLSFPFKVVLKFVCFKGKNSWVNDANMSFLLFIDLFSGNILY